LRRTVVQDQEVPNALVFGPENLVVAIDFSAAEIAIGEQRQKHGNAALNEVNAGGFQRLEEARRQADRNTVLAPEALAPAGGELQLERVGQCLTLDARQQFVLRLGVAHEASAVNVAIA